MRRLLGKKGISLAETIIAMAVVLIVSASATATVGYFASISNRMVQRNEATTIAENSMACFTYADNLTDFENLLADKVASFDKEGSVYTYQGDHYTVQLTVVYGADTATIAIDAHDDKERDILTVPLYERHYQ